ncbi:pyridoxal phosphate-dependent aminotransferase [Candidatus Peregrinibacteria bacterium]|nr:pyridoxal phosphate-dependent aminotransferase [Candidatus Peregrinibacteria bacterium]
MASSVNTPLGFDIEKTPPFLAFRILRNRAIEYCGESNVLDLSQGEPGYGFAPNVRSREFYAFLLLLDVEFNNNETEAHFANLPEKDLPRILGRIQKVAHENYIPEKAEKVLRDFGIFVDTLLKVTKEQKMKFEKFDILYDILKYAIPSGGRYPNPWGEPLVRAATANAYRHLLGIDVENDDIMLISGASHGIGTVFKSLGEEGIGFLQKGDLMLITSPVYAPYNKIIEDRGIKVFSLSVDPETGKVAPKSLEELSHVSERIKAMVLINPNNPTGFPYGDDLLSAIGKAAEKHNSLIITDEVYLQFFDQAKSILSLPSTRKRTIYISSISKTERATGIRFGVFLLLKEAREYISQNILGKDVLREFQDIQWLLYMAKSPGGKTLGAFQHITGIPGPSQILGLCHIILGGEERKKYFADLRKKVKIFYETLGMKHQGNCYYGMFDMKNLESPEKSKLSVEQKYAEIAERGVVLMPGNLFFSEEDRAKKDCTSYFRVSLPNLSFENTKKAAEILRKYLSE